MSSKLLLLHKGIIGFPTLLYTKQAKVNSQSSKFGEKVIIMFDYLVMMKLSPYFSNIELSPPN